MANLDELVTRYGTLKGEMDSYKKQVDEDNKEIKRLMSEQGLKTVSAGGYVATYSVSKSEGFDEDKLVQKLHSIWKGESISNPYIKMVFVPNMEAIENAIYNGVINAAELSDCRVTKETAKLLIKKEK